MTNIAAYYARVSSERQEKNNTILSQISELEKRIREDKYEIIDEFKFIDNGYTGSNLVRPALEKLRDKVSEGQIDKIYIHSPDRLSRKYAYQMILLEEFKKYGAEIIFLNYQSSDTPESNLLLHVQAVIAEYEREKIMERNRRGKIHAAKMEKISVLSKAPYGYRYIDKHRGNGQAFYEVHAQQAEVIQKIFYWVGYERVSLLEVCRRLGKMEILSPSGRPSWNRNVVWAMLKNPAYKGKAAFGKTRNVPKLPRLRPYKGSIEQPKQNYHSKKIEKESWIYISVPMIIDEVLFDSVQEQLEENRKIAARIGKKGATYLLQGLVVCKRCGYAYCGKTVKSHYISKHNIKKVYISKFYACTDSCHRGRNKTCNSKQIGGDTLEIAVWEEVKNLLENPDRILNEYQRRISELGKSPLDKNRDYLEKEGNKLKRGISRLIDSYSQEYIDNDEFEPRIKEMKKRLKIIEDKNKEMKDQKNLEIELSSVISNLEDFSSCIEQGLENLEWHAKRDIIRTLVKRIEIDQEDVNVVFRIHDLPPKPTPAESMGEKDHKILQHCSGRQSVDGGHGRR
jgi:site-specific DNA recombinase